MKRWTLGLCVAATLGVGLAPSLEGCDDGGRYDHNYGGGGGWAECEQYTTCGACTPVSGCGWCQASDGTGLCADDPSACAGAQQFSWTWDPSGCRVTADASVVTMAPEGGGKTAPDAGPSGDATADAGTSNDAGSNDAGSNDAGSNAQ
jgi:hypothetical protein